MDPEKLARFNEALSSEKGSHLESIKALLAASKHNSLRLVCSDLRFAAKSGNIERVKELLKVQGVDVNAKDHNGKTALMFAIESGNRDLIKELLKVPRIDINIKDINGDTALSRAVYQKDTQLAIELLKVPGIDADGINFHDLDVTKVVQEAMNSGNMQAVKEILKFPIFNQMSTSLFKEIISYSHEGSEEVFKAIFLSIDFSNDPDLDNKLMSLAVGHGSKEAVKSMLDVASVKDGIIRKKLVSYIKKYGASDAKMALVDTALESSDRSTVDEILTNSCNAVREYTFRSSAMTPGIFNAIINSSTENTSSRVLLAILQSPYLTKESLLETDGTNGVRTALSNIIQNGSPEVIRALLESDSVTPELLLREEEARITPILLLVKRENPEILQILFASGKVELKSLVSLTSSAEEKNALFIEMLKSEHPSLDLLTAKQGSSDSLIEQMIVEGDLEVLRAIFNSSKIYQDGATWQILFDRTLELHGEGSLSLLLQSPMMSRRILMTKDANGRTLLDKAMHAFFVTGKSSLEELKELLSTSFIGYKDLVIVDPMTGKRPIDWFTEKKGEALLKTALHESLIEEEQLDLVLANGSTLRQYLLSSDSEELLRGYLLAAGFKLDEHGKEFIKVIGSSKFNRFKKQLVKLLSVEELYKKNEDGISPILYLVRNGDHDFIQYLMESEKVSLDRIISDALDAGTVFLKSLVSSTSTKFKKQIIEMLSVEDLYKKDEDGRSLLLEMIRTGDKELIQFLIESEKVSIDRVIEDARAIESHDTDVFVFLKDCKDVETAHEFLKKLIDSGNLNIFKQIVGLSELARFTAAKYFGEQLLEATSIDSAMMSVSTAQEDTMPKPPEGVDIRDISSIADELFSATPLASVDLGSLSKMIGNVRERKPIIGLPNSLEEPEKFEAAYAQIERYLQVTTVVIRELKQKMDAATDDGLKKDLKEKLESVYSRLSEISEACGTRYSQDIPMLYQGELALMTELECIQGWQETEVAIPAYADPKEGIREHLSPTLYALKIEKLRKVYDLLAVTGDVHERSSFWKTAKVPFSLDESVDTDPLAHEQPHHAEVYKQMFLESLSTKEGVEALKKIVTAKGSSNPYISLISALAAKNGQDSSETLMEAFQMDEETYEYKEMTTGFLTLALIEAGILAV